MGSMETFFHTLVEKISDANILTPELTEVFGGGLSFTAPTETRPTVIANFVVPMIQPVLSFAEIKGREAGGEISGFNKEDGFILALLRTVADAVVVGSGTLKLEKNHKWTGEYIIPQYADLFRNQRSTRGLAKTTTVFLTQRGELPFDAPVFHDEHIRALVFTTKEGKDRLLSTPDRGSAEIISVDTEHFEEQVLASLRTQYGISLLLVEGPSIFRSMFQKGYVDELFLTRAPRFFGNTSEKKRPELAEGIAWNPDNAPQFEYLYEKKSLREEASGFRYDRYAIHYLHA